MAVRWCRRTPCRRTDLLAMSNVPGVARLVSRKGKGALLLTVERETATSLPLWMLRIRANLIPIKPEILRVFAFAEDRYCGGYRESVCF